MRVRASARLHVGDVTWMADVRNVKDANAADARRAHRVLHTLAAAVDASRLSFRGHEEQVLVDGHVTLRSRAVVPNLERRVARIRDVPDLVAVVVALDDVLSEKREIRVGAAEELVLRR